MADASGTVRIGDVEIVALRDDIRAGPWSLAEAFPDVPESDWREITRMHPEAVDGDRWRVRDYAFLLRTPDRTILVDTGIGPAGTGVAELLHPQGGSLLDELAATGVDPAAIDVVALTHMHFDHIGWNVSGPPDDPRPTFPRASYLLQRADWDAFAAQDEDAVGRPARDRHVRWLRQEGLLELVDGATEIADGVRLVSTPGHTAGSMSVEVSVGADRLLITGDVANHPLQITNPASRSFSDHDPGVASATRRSVFGEAERDGAIVAPGHFPEPFGRVGGGEWRPLG